jgi:pimeloyl-ACP methyl ester carboxylesterase
MRLAATAVVLTLAACGSADGGSGTTPPARRTTVLLVPGSGFRGADAFDGNRMAVGQASWRRWGFRVRVVGYGPGKDGPIDVAAALADELRRRPKQRVCLYGESSGGTWALLAAANNPDVDCVAVSGAPADEDTWRRSRRHAAHTFAHRIWPAYFGTGAADDAFEPLDVWRARKPAVPAFVVVARNDPTVPPQQGRVLDRRAGGDIELRVLPGGRWPFVHSTVNKSALTRVRAELKAFVEG